MLRKIAITTVLLLASLFGTAQFYDPVDWTYEAEYKEDGKVDLVFTASVEDHWHIYSLHIDGSGPLPTEFSFTENSSVTFHGEMTETEPIEEYDPNFDMVVRYHGDGVQFRRTVSVSKNTTIKGELSFMVCNDEMCLPPEWVEFEIPVEKRTAQATSTPVDNSSSQDAEPAEDPVDETASEEAPEESVVSEAGPSEETDEVAEAAAAEPQSETAKGASIWSIFGEGMLWGFAALLMPCIFPMIPLTVSFFTKQSKNKAEGIRKAIIYGLSINVIYVALGILITVIFGSDALNAMATDPWFNYGFFFLFVIFAISFFGAFELTLPSKWVNKADEASNKGGLIGIFFMAFTLSLVSFSCTGPLIGSLLVSAATSGELLGPAMGMLGFSFALSLPFMLFAAFPGWLNSLPKSGGWLNTVKVTMGFLELGFAMKFLSTADMVLQLHWLERELFLAIWVGISFMLALYLLGMFRLPHDSPIDKIGVGRMLTALLFFCFGFYLLPGIWGAPVKLVAGFPPPEHYAEVVGGSYHNSGPSSAAVITNENGEIVDFGDHCPLGINCFNDFEEGLAYAKEVNKPVMLDFTGWGCVNCRKMEEQVWTDSEVLKRLQEEVVLISLYVDERSELPADEQYVSSFNNKKVTRIGQKWSDFQAMHYGTNAQPYYVILNHDSMEPLNGSAAYDPNIQKFKDWLDEGVSLFHNQN